MTTRSVDWYGKRENMAGACTTCKALRLNSTLKRCFSTRFIPRKLKYSLPAAFISSVSFLGYRRSSEDRLSGSILWQRGRWFLQDFSVFCQTSCQVRGLRPFGTSAFLLQQGPGETKPGSGKIKAKIEQMKEMVRF